MKIQGNSRSKGAALVVVLSLLVLMLIITLAFFSRAMLSRQTSAASASNIQGDLLSQAAIEMILADIGQEILAGSSEDTFAASGTFRHVYRPLAVTNVLANSVPVMPSMVLQRVVAASTNSPASLTKQSLSNRPFFAVTNGYIAHPSLGTIPSRASAVNTSAAPARGRPVSFARWQAPRFTLSGETVPSPDWIYLDRRGRNPTSFSPQLSAAQPENGEYVIGRFAYNLYDVGGLADINVIGNALASEQNRRRGRLHQVSLHDAPSPLTVTNFSQFLAWRRGTASEPSDPEAANGLFDSRRSFIDVRPGAQAFVGRQDLLRYAKRAGSAIPEAALPFLTTFSRDVNAPGHAPDPNRPLLPASPQPAELNPGLLEARFPSEAVLARGQDADVTVPAGTPVVARRFPLSKLDLLKEENPDAETLEYYFGLRKNADGSLEYTAGIAEAGGYRVARLNEVAAMGREPNFFELLQAVILTGSLGRNSGNSYTLDDPRDELRNLHVFQIGANIIDQWDADDVPTALKYPSGLAGEWLEVYGVENLPYINNISLLAHRPEYDRNRFQIWGLFDVWNPHQNAANPPSGIAAFRLHPRSGQCRATLRYLLTQVPATYGGARSSSNYNPLFASTPPAYTTPFQSIVDLNADREFTFSASGDYSSPAIVGAVAPASPDSLPGLLFLDEPHVPPAIPDKPERSSDLQVKLNTLMDLEFPYTASTTHTGHDSSGNRLYPAGTTFSNFNTTYWTQIPAEGGKIAVYANLGVKAHNNFRIIPGDIGDKIIVELQYQPAGSDEWKTYQIVDRFLPLEGEDTDGIPPNLDGLSTVGTFTVTQVSEVSPGDLLKNTHHSKPDFDSKTRWYGWRERWGGVNLFKFDPRTIRFGHSGNIEETLGTTIRMSSNTYNGTTSETQTNWRLSRGATAGTQLEKFGDVGFEWMPVGTSSTVRYLPFGFIANIPEGDMSNANPSRYKDRDGIIRPGDGYLGALPTGPGRMAERPLILNRPFRSVGEIGYAFRDLPWKSVDFFSKVSGDLGLLDVFSLDEMDSDPPVVAGRVNLNASPREVLTALLTGSAKHPFNTTPSDQLSQSEAQAAAVAILTARSNAPFGGAGDLVRRVFAPTASVTPSASADAEKNVISREAPIRTLAAIGTTRTWNLMIDLIVQTGKFPPSAQTLAGFSVTAERRYWVHLAIDRFTGEVVDRQTELVHE